MEYIVAIFICNVLSDNFVLSQFLGICPFLGVSKKLNTALGMGVAVTAVMLLATAVTYPVQQLLDKVNMGYMQTLVFILMIAALVQLLEIILKRFLPPLYKALGIYLPLITTNCAVLGVCILNIDSGYSFITSLVSSLGAGVGFALSLCLFAGVREKLESSDIPKSLQGLPITLVAAGIVSLAFMGFKGVL